MVIWIVRAMGIGEEKGALQIHLRGRPTFMPCQTLGIRLEVDILEQTSFVDERPAMRCLRGNQEVEGGNRFETTQTLTHGPSLGFDSKSSPGIFLTCASTSQRGGYLIFESEVWPTAYIIFSGFLAVRNHLNTPPPSFSNSRVDPPQVFRGARSH